MREASTDIAADRGFLTYITRGIEHALNRAIDTLPTRGIEQGVDPPIDTPPMNKC